MENPYEKCPVFETEKFILRLVEKTDAEDLLECYSNEITQKYANSDNCNSDFTFDNIDEMNRCIESWISEYEHKKYIRFSIIYKVTQKAIGTIEIFGSKKQKFGTLASCGILRIDIHPHFETKEYLKELVYISIDKFYTLFNIENIVTKVIPEAKNRVEILMNYGFKKLTNEIEPARKNYYIRTQKK
jgi:RimJ/RimL family protein N-acetyltransferase